MPASFSHPRFGFGGFFIAGKQNAAVHIFKKFFLAPVAKREMPPAPV